MLAQRYALVVGVVLLLTGLLGLVLGEQLFLGILNIDILEDVVHLATGGLLAYAGLARDVELARTLVGALGVVYLVVGIPVALASRPGTTAEAR